MDLKQKVYKDSSDFEKENVEKTIAVNDMYLDAINAKL